MGCGFGREAYLFAEVLQDALGFARGKFAVIAPDEERSDWGGGEAAIGVEGEELGYAGLSDVVERDDPGLSGFGEVGWEVEFVPWGSVVGDQVDGEATGFPESGALPFRYPESRVEEEQDQEIVSSPERALEIDPA